MAIPLEITGRSPAAPPMKALPLKLPPELLEQLQQQAQRIGAYPSALARALVARGLAEMTEGQ